MIIKLCYKEYPAKMSLGAMDYYDEATNGRDLWGDLLTYIETWQKLRSESDCTIIELCAGMHKLMGFKNASYIFHSVIREEDSSRSLAEIRDAMFAVGWLPTEDESGLAEPWPLIMHGVALDIDRQMREFAKKKKLASLDQ